MILPEWIRWRMLIIGLITLPIGQMKRMPILNFKRANSNRNNPAEIAKNCLAKKLGRDKSILEEPHKIQTLRGVIVYEWMLSKTKGFRVTVGHPYALLPYLKDPVKFPWIVVAVFNKANNDGETTVADISKLRGKKNNPQKYAQSLKAEF
jgi:hypothetical protein